MKAILIALILFQAVFIQPNSTTIGPDGLYIHTGNVTIAPDGMYIHTGNVTIGPKNEMYYTTPPPSYQEPLKKSFLNQTWNTDYQQRTETQ